MVTTIDKNKSSVMINTNVLLLICLYQIVDPFISPVYETIETCLSEHSIKFRQAFHESVVSRLSGT
jgi:hypothetical protein